VSRVWIPCERGKVYIGQTGRSIETRCKEHTRYTRLEQPEKSVAAKSISNMVYCTDFSRTSMLHKAAGYMDRLVKKQFKFNQKPEILTKMVASY
jgi:predicted GIY-YIG superfamily endonuclease